MNRIRSFDKWKRNRICIFHMPKSSTQILASLTMMEIPCTIYESTDTDVREDFISNIDKFCGIIISGGMLGPNDSVPQLPHDVFESDLPKLGICLGHEILGTSLGSNLVDCNPSGNGEYGEVIAKFYPNLLFEGIDISQEQMVKMEHHKMLDKNPEGSELIASTLLTPFAGFHHKEKSIWGLQFHPEKDWLAQILIKNFYNYCYSII